MKIRYYNGSTSRVVELEDLLGDGKKTVRDKITRIAFLPEVVNVPDFTQPIEKGAPTAWTTAELPVEVKRDVFTDKNFPKLEKLDFGKGGVTRIEDGALANLPKLKEITWQDAFNQGFDDKLVTKYTLGAFINNGIPEAERTKINDVDVIVDSNNPTTSTFKLNEVIAPLKDNEEYRNSKKAVVKEPKQSTLMKMLKGLSPIKSGILGGLIGGIGFMAVTAVSALVTGGFGAIIPFMGAALADAGLCAGIGVAVAELPLLRLLTKKGRAEWQMQRQQRLAEKARKNEAKYNKYVEKAIKSNRKALEESCEYFGSTSVLGTVKHGLNVVKVKANEFKSKVFTGRALRKSDLLGRLAEKSDNAADKIKEIESASGKTYSQNGLVQEYLNRENDYTSSVGTKNETMAQMRLNALKNAIKQKSDAKNITNAIGEAKAGIHTGRSLADAQQEKYEATVSKGHSKMEKEGLDLTR